MKQNALTVALNAALAAKNGTAVSPANVRNPANVDAPTPKGKVAKLRRFEADGSVGVEQLATDVEMYFADAKQAEALTDYVILTADLAAQETNVRKSIWDAVAKIFPADAEHAPTWNQVDVIKRTCGLVADSGDYLYVQTILGLRRLPSLGAKYDKVGNLLELGTLPASAGGKKKGKREKSAANFQRYTALDIKKISERIREYRGAVSAKDMAQVADALKQLDIALRKVA